MSRPREMSDGSLVFPSRGKPPPERPGYQRAPGEPFRLIQIMPECAFRWKGSFKPACCDAIIFYKCEKGFEVSGLKCQACIASGRRESAPKVTSYN